MEQLMERSYHCKELLVSDLYDGFYYSNGIGYTNWRERDAVIWACKNSHLKVDTLDLRLPKPPQPFDDGLFEKLLEFCTVVSPLALECYGGTEKKLLITVPFGQILSRLQKLQFHHIGLGDVEMQHFVEVPPNSQLRELSLIWNKIGDEGAKYLAKALQSPHTQLRILDLRGNEVGDEGVKHIAKALQSSNSRLEQLLLYQCNVGDAGVRYLSHAFKTSYPRIRVLDLGNNHITDEAVEDIACILDSLHTVLEKLSILKNEHITKGGGKRVLIDSLQRPKNTLKTLRLQKIGNEEAEYIARSLQSPHCQLLLLDVFASSDEVLMAIANSVEMPNCKLQELTYQAEFDLKEGKKKLLLALDSSYWCPLTRIEYYDLSWWGWRDEAFDRTSESLMSRNTAIRDGDLLRFEREQPPTGKLFVCGNATLTKQHIINSILHRPPLKKTARKLGMNLSFTPFSLGNLQNLLVSEVAEGDDYFPFFSKAPRHSVFLLVCNAPLLDGQFELNKQLRYWLTSITSSSQYHGPNPKVMICLCFPKEEHNKVSLKKMEKIAQLRTEFIIREFQEHIDFSEGNLFATVEGKGSKIKDSIKNRIKSLFHELQSVLFPIPSICNDLLHFLIDGKKFPACSINTIISEYQGRSDATRINIEAAIQLLASNGLIIYHAKSKVVIGAPEFLASALHALKSTSTIQDCSAREDIAVRLQHKLQVQQDLVYHVLYCLLHEGILRLEKEEKEEWDDDLHKVPAGFLNIMRSNTKLEWPSEFESSHVFWGRRFECNNKQTRLPRQLFLKLQSRQGACYMAADWIHCVENDISVVVQIGGEMQWIDILFRVPEERRYDNEQEFILARYLEQIHHICYAEGICPNVRLIEKVIENGAVQRLETYDAETVPLSLITAELEENGANHHHRRKDGSSLKIKELISPLEWSTYVRKSEHEIMEEYGLEEISIDTGIATPQSEIVRPQCSSNSSSISRLMKMLSFADIRNLFRQSALEEKIEKLGQTVCTRLEKLENNVGARFDKLDNGMEEQKVIFQQLVSKADKLEKCVDEMNCRLTKKLFQLITLADPPFPRLPYLTDEHGVLQTLLSLFQITSKLHFMCEWEGEGGAHIIDGDHKGYKVKLQREWVVRAAPILVPALEIISLALQATARGLTSGACSLPLPTFFGVTLLQKGVLAEVLIKFSKGMDGELTEHWVATPDPTLLKDFLELTLPRILSLKDFGLFRVHTSSGISYLCDRHSRGFKHANNQRLFCC